MGSQDLPEVPMMKAVLVLSFFIAQSFGQTAECNPPLPSECAEGDISCDMGTYAGCWHGDFCMPEGSECPPSCNTPAPSQCQDGEVMCDLEITVCLRALSVLPPVTPPPRLSARTER